MKFEKLKIVNKKHPNGIVALKGHVAICNDYFDVACVYTDFTGFEKYVKLFKESTEMFDFLKETFNLCDKMQFPTEEELNNLKIKAKQLLTKITEQ